MKISDVLWEAANEHLWDGEGKGAKPDRYSCDAVMDVDYGTGGLAAMCFLHELGCNTNSAKMFDEFEAGAERQGARYLWLTFAYLVALDEGL